MRSSEFYCEQGHIFGDPGFDLLCENYEVGTWLQCPYISVRCCLHLCAWHCGFTGSQQPFTVLRWGVLTCQEDPFSSHNSAKADKKEKNKKQNKTPEFCH